MYEKNPHLLVSTHVVDDVLFGVGLARRVGGADDVDLVVVEVVVLVGVHVDDVVRVVDAESDHKNTNVTK